MNVQDEELPAQEAIREYLLAAARFNDLVNREQEVTSQVVQYVASRAAAVFYAYNLPCNWQPDGQPRVHIPPQLARDVARNIQMALSGKVPQWMLHLARKGAPLAHPAMLTGIGLAVAYKKLCTTGQLPDKKPTKTIADAYGVSRKCVQGWERKYAFSEPCDWFPQATDEAERASLISAELPKAAARYQQWGRGPKNRRPHGKARRRPSTKR